MKRFAPFFFLLAAFFPAPPLAAATGQPLPISTVVVHPFTNGNGMAQSQDFIQYFSDYVSQFLEKDKIAAQVVEQGTPVPGADAAHSLLIDGKFLSHENASLIKPGKLIVEISIYRLSDHALVKTWTTTTHFPPGGDHQDRRYAYYTGVDSANAILDALRSVDLSSIPPPTPGSSPASPVAAPPPPSNAATTPETGAAPAPETPSAIPDAFASVQLSSDPTGAEITIDGNYEGNTPSLIKLGPGKHSITMTMRGYAPWTRSIQTAAGESRTVDATLDKTTQ
ncbi:MAG TPA: PEGA domain-containing protein [Acidobacteriaceae bacterium]|jgi:hypothetical protein|nr:PEGA domain-containing protein [Acidobacteriaceae bacterium]